MARSMPDGVLEEDGNRFHHRSRGGPIRTFTVSLIGAAALAAGLLLIRQQKNVDALRFKDVPPGETVPTQISLDRIRSLGY